ncbi:MAG: hypothetical protein WC455_19400 [Dehalococcoidia bacterium]|jgi:hypothetical protein
MNIVGKLVWRGQAVMAQVEAKVQQNMDRAAIYLVNDVVAHFGSPSAMPDIGLLKHRGNGNFTPLKAKEWRKMQSSTPGDPPFVQTGMLRRSIHWNAPSKLVRLVGSTLKPQGGKGSYALCLEYGTVKMAARPYLRPALARCRKAMFRIITGH